MPNMMPGTMNTLLGLIFIAISEDIIPVLKLKKIILEKLCKLQSYYKATVFEPEFRWVILQILLYSIWNAVCCSKRGCFE